MKRRWRKSVFLNRFRSMVDGIVENAGKNVAFSLHDPAGQMVGACARELSAREAICR